MRVIKRWGLFIIFLIPKSIYSQAQISTWTSIQLDYKLNGKSNLKVVPIFRHQNNISSFQDLFLDTSLDYKMNQKWKFKILNRVVSDFKGKLGVAFFIDLSYKTDLFMFFKLVNRLRYHFGLDLEIFQKDFLRFEPKLVFDKLKGFEFTVAIDVSYNTDNSIQLYRYRHQFSGLFQIHKKIGIKVSYWLDSFPTAISQSKRNTPIVVSSLLFSLN